MKKARSLRQRWLDRGAAKAAKREASKPVEVKAEKPTKKTKAAKSEKK